MVNLKICPTCGSARIRRVRRTITRTFKGKTYKVPGVDFHECQKCGEQIFSPEAVRKIQGRSPAFMSSKAC